MDEKYRKIIRKLIPSQLLNSLVNLYTYLLLFLGKSKRPYLVIRPNTSDFLVFRQIFVQKDYDIFPKEFYPKIIFDCGANIGLSSLYFSEKYPEAKIIAVEPESENFETMKKNIREKKNIKPYKFAIWNKNGFLKIEDSGVGEWGFTTKEVNNEKDSDVEAITIDKLMEINKVKHIDLLKLDIEGAEKEVFEKGYDKWLSKVDTLIIELHDRTKEGCSESFYKAIKSYKFTEEISGENIILRKEI